MDPKHIAVFFGGRSGEHEISLISAGTVVQGLRPEKFHVVGVWIDYEGRWFLQNEAELRKAAGSGRLSRGGTPCHFAGSPPRLYSEGPAWEQVDFAFPALHGTFGEDGRIQGLFEMMDIPYGGSGAAGSALAMDKILTRQVLSALNFPQLSYVALQSFEYEHDPSGAAGAIANALPFPIFIKPANLGSSVGISKARNRTELEAGLRTAFTYDIRIIAEEGRPVRELEVALLGNPRNLRVSPVGEVLVHADFYSYEAKYLDPKASELSIPARIPEKIRARIDELARTAFCALCLSGFARADFFLATDDDTVYFNEVNTIPGLTPASLFPLLWKEAGLQIHGTIEAIVDAGMERHRERSRLQVRFPGAREEGT